MHPDIVATFGMVQTATEVWAVLSFCELGSLDNLMFAVTGSADDPKNIKDARKLLEAFPLTAAAEDSDNPVLALRALIEKKLGSALTGFGKAFIRIGEQISGAVAYIHKMGIVHADIKVRFSHTTI